jgi:protein pelota
VRVLKKDEKAKRFKLMIDNLDDLWHLYNLIEEHDIVSGLTQRRIEKADDKLRPEKTTKKHVWLGISVERLEFHEFSNRLRIHGTIVQGPEDMGLKSYHTLNFTSGNQIELQKQEAWRAHQLEQLKAAVNASKQPQVTIIAIEDDNAVIALLHQYGIRNLANIRVQGMGKLFSGQSSKKGGKKISEVKKDFFNDILLQLEQVRPEKSPLIIVGPGFTKDDFMKFIKDKNLPDFSNILVETIGQAGMVGVQEAIKRGVVKRLVQDSRVAFETELVEKLLAEIATDGPISYGLNETKSALESGAVETILVIDKMIRGKNDEVNDILANTENIGGNVVIISTVHDAGKQLEALGGIAALLRYKIT